MPYISPCFKSRKLEINAVECWREHSLWKLPPQEHKHQCWSLVLKMISIILFQYKKQPTVHRIHHRDLRQVRVLWTLGPIARGRQMRTLQIPLRFIRDMQRNYFMPNQIIPRLQSSWNRVRPQLRSSIPILSSQYLLSPHSFLYHTVDETPLCDFKPIALRGVVCHPENHWPDGVQPVLVRCFLLSPARMGIEEGAGSPG